MKNIHLLVIDPQNDFCDPKGSLYVGNPKDESTGAIADMRRLAAFIRRNVNILTDITLTYDSHYVYDIAHPMFWNDSKGKNPPPIVTVISLDDVKNGVWTPTNPGELPWVREYLQKLADNGRYQHRIWPEHCLIGNWGHGCFPEVIEAVHQWERARVGKYNAVTKGSNFRVEHFSAVRAEVEDPEDQEGTGLNVQFVETIRDCDTLLVAGEALDFCIASTLRDVVKHFGPDYARKIVLLADCMSSVLDPAILSAPFLAEMKALGVQVSDSASYQPN